MYEVLLTYARFLLMIELWSMINKFKLSFGSFLE